MALRSRLRRRRSGDRRFAERQARLFAALACPKCRGPLATTNPTHAAGAVVAGDLRCAAHGRVGVIEGFQPSFLDRDLERHPPGAAPKLVSTSVDLDALVGTTPGWTPSEAGFLAMGTDSESLTIPGGGRARLRFYGNEWSGVVRIDVPGGSAIEEDLYRAEFAPIDVDVPATGSGTLTVTATGRHHADSLGAQVRLGAVEVEAPVAKAPAPSLTAANRGNPYPERMHELVAAQPDTAMILDCGGGDRRYGDDRVFNLEYLAFDLPDLFADGLALPFADETFDLVVSQAVLEHVPDPQRAIDEMARILTPGGTLYVEVAFLQPVHAVPHHFMNVTPHGLAHLCRDLDIVAEHAQGGVADLVDWVGRLSDAPSLVGDDRFAEAMATLRDLDAACDDATRAHFAFASVIEARKP